MTTDGKMNGLTALLVLAGLGLLIAGALVAKDNTASYLLLGGGLSLNAALTRVVRWARKTGREIAASRAAVQAETVTFRPQDRRFI